MSERYDPGFRPADINVLKLNMLVDIEIAAAECAFAIESIERQLKDGFDSDPEWRAAAEFALSEIKHKARLIDMKRPVVAARAAQSNSPEQTYAVRFVKTAMRLLPPDAYHMVASAAAIDKQVAA